MFLFSHLTSACAFTSTLHLSVAVQLATPAQISQEQGLDVQTVQQFCGQWVKVSYARPGSGLCLTLLRSCISGVTRTFQPPAVACCVNCNKFVAALFTALQVGARSDSLDSFCELFGVPKWLRQATRLMTGMQISITDDTLIVKQVGLCACNENFACVHGQVQAVTTGQELHAEQPAGAWDGHALEAGRTHGFATNPCQQDTMQHTYPHLTPHLLCCRCASWAGYQQWRLFRWTAAAANPRSAVTCALASRQGSC